MDLAALGKLCGLDLPGKEHVEAYLRDQYRRHLSSNTLRNSLTTIRGFLEFVKREGRSHVEEISRESSEGYIEQRPLEMS